MAVAPYSRAVNPMDLRKPDSRFAPHLGHEARLVVEGEEDRIERFAASARGFDAGGRPVPLDFERLEPTPRGLLLTGRKFSETEEGRELLAAHRTSIDRGGTGLLANEAVFMMSHPSDPEPDGWRVFRLHHWGCQRRLRAEYCVVSDSPPRTYVIWFSSPEWAPVHLLERVAPRFPDLRFELSCFAPEGCSAAHYVFQEGRLVTQRRASSLDGIDKLLCEAGWPG